MTDTPTTRTIRSPQQIAEDAAERSYAALLAARKTKAAAVERAEAATAKAVRAEGKFQHAITDIDISDEFRDGMIARLEAEVAGSSSSETATAVPATEVEASLDAAVSDAMEASDEDDETVQDPALLAAIRRKAAEAPEREIGSPAGTQGGPKATKTTGREDFIDGLPESNGPAALEGAADAVTDESADSSSVVPGEMPLV